MNTLEENAVKDMMNMSEEEINRLATEHLSTLTSQQMANLKERAEAMSGTKMGKDAVKNLQKKGITRKKMMKQMKDAKKNAPKPLNDGIPLSTIFINNSRKIKQVFCNQNTLEKEIKKILKCQELAEFVCFQISVGPLTGKYISVYFDASKSCEGVGNRRIYRITGIHNSGTALFVCKEGGIEMSDFLEAEKELMLIR